jgi:hypothetical protein
MSRLDQHVAAVQNKLALERFVHALVWALLVYAGVVTLDLLVARLIHVQFPHPKVWFWAGAGVATLVAMVWAIVHRPSRKAAAVAIDEKLGLHTKISTALFLRNNTDAFAIAAVKDAEATAQNVVLNYYQHFPMRFPRATYGMVAMAVVAVAVSFLKPMDLLGREAKQKEAAKVEVERTKATAAVKQALATVEAVPKSMANDEAIKKAQIDLNNLLKQPIKDPTVANRTAMKALEDAKAAVKRQAEQNSKFAETQDQMKNLAKAISPPKDELGPIADAQRKMADGKFTEAFNQLDDVVKKFDKMDEEQKKQVAQQMRQMAKQLQQAAQNQQQQQQQAQKALQQIQQQLGINQQQMQQMAQAMQQNAGNPQQQQQALAQQLQQNMGMNQQQAQAAAKQMQQAMQQAQQQQNAAQNQGQMAQAAQQMAQAMQQAAQGQQAQGQQANQGQQGQQGQQGNGQQQMQQAMAQMQQQLQNMQQGADEGQAAADAQQAMQQAADQAADNMNGQGQGQGQGGDKLAGRENGANPWGQGNPQGKGQGMGGPGIGAGGRAGKDVSPFATKAEQSPTPDNEKGKILASNYIKDNHPVAGKSSETLKDVAEAAEHQAADEVDNERINAQARSAVKKYFQTMQEGEAK